MPKKIKSQNKKMYRQYGGATEDELAELADSQLKSISYLFDKEIEEETLAIPAEMNVMFLDAKRTLLDLKAMGLDVEDLLEKINSLTNIVEEMAESMMLSWMEMREVWKGVMPQ